MPAGNAVQFKGVSAVVDAYTKQGIPAFAVAYLKDINFRYRGDDLEEGGQLLRAWLEKLKEFGTQAGYQLRLYEDLGDKQIKSNTAYDMAFKFVVNEKEENSYLPVKSESNVVSNSDLIRILGEMANLKAENAVLQLKIEQYENEEEETEAPKEVGQAPPVSIGQMLLERLAPALGVIGERLADAILPAVEKAKIAGIVVENASAEEEQLIEQSLRRMRNAIPDKPGLAHILMLLADMAEKQPGNFNFYVTMLMKQKV